MKAPIDISPVEATPGRTLVSHPVSAVLDREFEEWRSADRLVSIGESVALEIRGGGVETLAHYTSFRAGAHWGIYIKRQGILGVAAHLTAGTQTKRAIKLAYKALYHHELFHFRVDCAYLKLENALKNLAPEVALQQEHQSKHGAYDQLEEALANAYAIRRAKESATKSSLSKLFKNSPPGYKDFGKFLPDEAFRDGLSHLIGASGTDLERQSDVSGLGLLVDFNDSEINGFHVPVYLEH